MRSIMIGAAAGVIAALSFAAVASAEPAKKPRDTGLGYLTDGKSYERKGNRVTNPDGSWREETRDKNNCITIKELRAGVYHEKRECPKP